LRDVLPTSDASIGVRRHVGQSLKSSIKYVYQFQNINNPYTPSVMSFSTELAGLLGNARFLKTEGSLQFNIPLFRKLSLNFGGNAGLMIPFDKSSRINDRFFLGGVGPNSLRGFEVRGVYPHNSKDSLGGDVYYSLFSSLSYCVAKFRGENPVSLYLHAFHNFGNLFTIDKGASISKNYRSLFNAEDTRVTVGIGGIARTPWGNIEVNYCYPLRTSTNDKTARFQLGVVAHF